LRSVDSRKARVRLTSRRNDNADMADFGVDDLGNARGVPGIWIKDVDASGHMISKACPLEGRLDDVVSIPINIVHDMLNVALCRTA
jgi:hypothetical protein